MLETKRRLVYYQSTIQVASKWKKRPLWLLPDNLADSKRRQPRRQNQARAPICVFAWAPLETVNNFCSLGPKSGHLIHFGTGNLMIMRPSTTTEHSQYFNGQPLWQRAHTTDRLINKMSSPSELNLFSLLNITELMSIRGSTWIDNEIWVPIELISVGVKRRKANQSKAKQTEPNELKPIDLGPIVCFHINIILSVFSWPQLNKPTTATIWH